MLRAIWIDVSLVSRDRAAARTGRGEAMLFVKLMMSACFYNFVLFWKRIGDLLSSNGSRANAKTESTNA